MTSRKSHNSLIFITTLGVYLGLVLVGGSAPQVFAHSALTRNFEISDEIEVKDDLDKKPDGDEALEQYASAFVDIYRSALEISADRPYGIANGEFDFHQFVTVNTRGGGWAFSPGIFNNGPRTFSGRYTKPLHRLYDAFLPRADQQHEKFRVDLELTQSDVTFQTLIFDDGPIAERPAASPYVDSLSRRRSQELSVLKSLIYGSTTIETKPDHVAIVTRLPRASIDPLLAADAR